MKNPAPAGASGIVYPIFEIEPLRRSTNSLLPAHTRARKGVALSIFRIKFYLKEDNER